MEEKGREWERTLVATGGLKLASLKPASRPSIWPAWLPFTLGESVIRSLAEPAR